MLKIKNVKKLDGTVADVEIESDKESLLDAKGRWLLMPALIDPHVHFRVPGHAYKEDWMTGAKAAIAGGVTSVFDMPNTTPPPVTPETVRQKMGLIDSHLKHADIPLRYHLWLGADKEHLSRISESKDLVVGIKVYMGSTTGGLLMDDPAAIEQVFKIAGENHMIVAVHAEDEEVMQKLKAKHLGATDPAVHSKIRHREAAIVAVKQAIALAEKFRTKLYIAHVSTLDELELIRQAKKKNIQVYAEVTPHHLHLTQEHYSTHGTLVQMNPPVRTQDDIEALWEGIADGTIDTIGSDHAPHTLDEKKRPYGKAPSGVPGVEMILPLLLNAYHRGKISLEKIVELTSTNPKKLFGIKDNDDAVLVDIDLEKTVSNLQVKSKCGWTPYADMKLKGWPIYTILRGEIYETGS